MWQYIEILALGAAFYAVICLVEKLWKGRNEKEKT